MAAEYGRESSYDHAHDNNSQDKVKKSPEVVEEVVSEAIQRLRKRLSDVRIKVHMPNDFLMIPWTPH